MLKNEQGPKSVTVYQILPLAPYRTEPSDINSFLVYEMKHLRPASKKKNPLKRAFVFDNKCNKYIRSRSQTEQGECVHHQSYRVRVWQQPYMHLQTEKRASIVL